MAAKQYPVTRTDAEWRALLTPEQYDIMRRHGTEAPGSCALNFEKRAGTFLCAGCDQPLFVSKEKFESGTGWPSFTEPAPGHGAHRGALQPLRQPLGPRLPRWPPAHRPALLHQRRGHEVRAEGVRW
jgi:SelR domain